MLIPKLRVVVGGDLKNGLASWLDDVQQQLEQQQQQQQQQSESNGGTDSTDGEDKPPQSEEGSSLPPDVPDFSTTECAGDLDRMEDLRSRIRQSITCRDGHAEALENNAKDLLQEYHATLMECESKGFRYAPLLQLQWLSATSPNNQELDVMDTLAMEKASVLWNIAALEAHQASQQDFSKKQGWQKANKHLQLASNLFHHVSEALKNDPAQSSSDNNNNTNGNASNSNSPDFTTVPFWFKALQAQAQMAGYETANANSRPRHLLLGKLAIGAAPMWHQAVEACNGSPAARRYQSEAQAWCLFMQAKAEYHESITHKDKSKFGMELARLQRSQTGFQSCQQVVRSNDGIDDRLTRETNELLEAIGTRLRECQSLVRSQGESVPEDVREIRGETLTKGPQPLPKALTELATPMFTSLLGPVARRAVDTFHRDMDRLIFQMAALVEEKTDSARKTLARVNLPHSLTAYKQEQSGGGIPMDLWDRVETIQQQRQMQTIKNDLWELRDVAEHARSIFGRVEKHLEEDLQMDSLFREQHPNFAGRNVQDIQRTFRSTLANYEKLLSKSQEGDAVLLRRLEHLDTDPKYKLLQFQKSQLDRLLPGSGNNAPAINTTQLSRLLVELSSLFHEREVALNMLRDEAANYDIRAKLAETDPASPTLEQDCHQCVVSAEKSFTGIAYDIQLNIDKQLDLMETILQENEKFMGAREASASSSASDSCIAMIEDAIEVIDQLTDHLKEGRNFYNVVIPKLEMLKQQVGDASVRLTVERCEYEDNAQDSEQRRRQEADDARMAASLADNSGGSPEGGGNNNNDNNESSNSIGHASLHASGGLGNDGSRDNLSDNPLMGGGPGGGMNGGMPLSASGGRLDGNQNDSSHPLSNQPNQDYQGRGDVLPASSSSQPGVVTVLHDEPQIRVDDEKVASLVAMDFDPDRVVQALRKYDNNVEQALNELLSC